MSDTTFIYALCEPGTRTIRYIGKANNPKKRYKNHLTTTIRRCGHTHLGKWLSKLIREDLKPDLLILKSIPIVEWEWWECSFIRNARMLGFDLINGTEGGDGAGTGGVKHTPEGRKKMSDANKGKSKTPEHREKLSLANLGKTLTPEQMANRASCKGENNPMFGKKHSEETKAKISAANFGHVTVGFTGRKHSEESRRKISESLTRRKNVPA